MQADGDRDEEARVSCGLPGQSPLSIGVPGEAGDAGALAVANLPLAVLGLRLCGAGTRPALEYSEPGGVSQASGELLSIHVQVFSSQEGVADGLCLTPRLGTYLSSWAFVLVFSCIGGEMTWPAMR